LLRSRRKWNASRVGPDDMRSILNTTARKGDRPPINGRFGHGVVDAEAAYVELEAQFP
jgi:hypothetical protein